ncbi:MAG: DUF1257 domain-containing protein [Chloroflexi bacterium]|nr:DUF1257 domain-containing protein [Anaerolineaceae bacterium]NMB90159.1 DUF1257 domain-containing protein [Chloroflexota bacterium]
MSHFSRLKTQIVEKEFLLKAITDLGYTYKEGELILKGFGDQNVPVEITIPLRFSYDIGFRKNQDTYEIVADWWGVHGVKRQEFTRKLFQRYAYHAARARLEEQGFTLVSEETENKGQIRLVLRRME